MSESSTERIRAWVVDVRKKFNLPAAKDEYLSVKSIAYWRGYDACLQDVERMADTHEGGESDG